MSEYKQGNNGASPTGQPAYEIDALLFRLRKHLIPLTLATFIGGIAGVGLAIFLPKQWEAKVLIQVGQTFAVSPDGVGTPTSLEQPARTAEWLQSQSVETEVLDSLGLPVEAGVNRDTDLLRAATKVRYLRGAELVEMSTRGYSPEQAKRVLMAYQANLVSTHGKLLAPALNRMKSDLSEVNAAIAVRSEEQASLESNAKYGARLNATERFSANALVNQLRDHINEQLRILQQRRVTLQEALNPERTFNSYAISPVSVAPRPVFPKRSVFGLLGAVIGALFGTILVTLRTSQRR